MANELLERCIRELMDAHANLPTVAWQGGEPTLMGIEFFRRSVELVNQYLQPGQRAEGAIQTKRRRSRDARRGRNAPCPCGSGRKWKLCHGRGVGASR